MLPKQSTGLFGKSGSTKTTCRLWGKTLTFLRQTSFVSPTHTPLALLNRFTARQRAECEGFVLSVNPSGASRHLPHRGRHLTLPLPFVSKRKRKPVRCAEIMNFIDSLRGRNPKVSPPRLLT